MGVISFDYKLVLDPLLGLKFQVSFPLKCPLNYRNFIMYSEHGASMNLPITAR